MSITDYRDGTEERAFKIVGYASGHTKGAAIRRALEAYDDFILEGIHIFAIPVSTLIPHDLDGRKRKT